VDPVDFLLSLERLGMKFGLENITILSAALRHPEASFRPVIVAGTNGKGSVTAMVSAALHAAGHKSARYTSPHLERLEERFVIEEREVTRAELQAVAGAVQQIIERLVAERGLDSPPTFFEAATAIALELFHRAGVEIAVLEVGLGGRLDATNVVTPVVAAITSVGLDHQAQLGNSLPDIAREKAGVIKPGVPLVCGPVPAEAEAVISAICAERCAPLIRASERVQTSAIVKNGDTIATLRSPAHTFSNVHLALGGRHQADNAAVALCVMEQLSAIGIHIDQRAMLAGLTEVKWPGRLERFTWRGADVLLDAAHNPAGAAALAAYLQEAAWMDVTLLFGAMGDKDVEGMLSALLPVCQMITCTTAPTPRAVPAEELAGIARALASRHLPRGPLPSTRPRIEAVADPAAALDRACETGTRVVAAGSIFLIGPLRGILR
jgi:dihydrofolate synthase/folylpolyglutamate synthase